MWLRRLIQNGGDEEAVELVERLDPDELNEEAGSQEAERAKGWTAVHWAAAKDSTVLLDLFCRKCDQATLCVRSRLDKTPLHVAAMDGSCATAELLLEAMPPSAAMDLDACNMTPLRYAAERVDQDLLSLFLPYATAEELAEEDEYGSNAFTDAASAGAIENMRKVGALLHEEDLIRSGNVALAQAVLDENAEVVAALLEILPPEVKQMEYKGQSMLDIAIERGNDEIIGFFQTTAKSAVT